MDWVPSTRPGAGAAAAATGTAGETMGPFAGPGSGGPAAGCAKDPPFSRGVLARSGALLVLGTDPGGASVCLGDVTGILTSAAFLLMFAKSGRRDSSSRRSCFS